MRNRIKFIIILLFSLSVNAQNEIVHSDKKINFENLFGHSYRLYLENKTIDNTTKILYDSISPNSYFYIQTEEFKAKDSNENYLRFRKIYPDLDININHGHGNTCSILINHSDSVFIRGESFENKVQFKHFLREFLSNPEEREDLPEKHVKEIEYFGNVMVARQHIFLYAQMISKKTKCRTSFEKLFETLNQIIIVNNGLRNEIANIKWGKNYSDLEWRQKKSISEIYPLKIRIYLNYELPPIPPPPPPLEEKN